MDDFGLDTAISLGMRVWPWLLCLMLALEAYHSARVLAAALRQRKAERARARVNISSSAAGGGAGYGADGRPRGLELHEFSPAIAPEPLPPSPFPATLAGRRSFPPSLPRAPSDERSLAV